MRAYIYDALRTIRGKARPDGALAGFKPQQLIGGLVDALESRGAAPRRVESLVLGCVGQVGDQGGNIALVSKLCAGIADEAYAFTLNGYCVSGLTAVGHLAAQVAAGILRRGLAGGVEMMSRVPFLGDGAAYYGDAEFPRRARFVPVVLAADRLAEAQQLSREQLDTVALVSQQRAAIAEGRPATAASRIALGRLDLDECVRSQASAASLAALQPGFAALAEKYADALAGPIDHRHTIGHAPPMCDGAGLALIGAAPGEGERPRARILDYVECGGDPQDSLLAGFTAMERVLARTGLALADFDRIEFMEAFAVTIARFLRDYPVDPARVNVAGGHIARGHPMGASGAILLSQLLDVLDDADGTLGLLVCSGATGLGAALAVERLR